jgi:hypothetical protein
MKSVFEHRRAQIGVHLAAAGGRPQGVSLHPLDYESLRTVPIGMESSDLPIVDTIVRAKIGKESRSP